MAYVNPQESFDTLKTRVADTVKQQFPIEGDKQVLVAKKVWVDDNLDSDDIRGQKDAKLKGRTWSVPVRAEFELQDKATGKVKDRQVMTVAQLPKITRRYSYVVNGNEYQVNNLFRLKSGVYSRIGAGGDIEGQWNLAKGLGFRMKFDPKNKKMSMKYPSGVNVPLYPVLKNMGVSDGEMEDRWGKEILTANMKDAEEPALRKFYKSFKGDNPDSLKSAKKFMIEELGKTELRPDSTKLTLGEEFKKVDGGSLLAGSNKLLRVARKEDEPDDRDSLAFKELWSAEDLISERLEKKSRWDIQRKIKNTLDKHGKVKHIVNSDFIGKPLKSFFTSSTLSDRPDQMNPVSFTSGNRRTTLMAPGEGGISSAHQVSLEAQSINPSHVGFLDPIQTPESARIGVNLQMASGVKKDGRDLKVRAFNTKTKKTEWITPVQASASVVAFPDQYEFQKGKAPRALSKLVKVSDSEGTITQLPSKKVDYIFTSTKGMFDLSANMIPFLQSDQGNRTMVAAKQLEQAVPLVSREVPLVQSKGDTAKTFEQGVGGFNAHTAPVDGTVQQVKKDGIVIKGTDGKRHEVQLYDDFPLNDSRSLLNSKAVVKKGDTVKRGQLVGDTNFTKGGTLALGTNLNIAYMPFKGYNYEDGVVISETAAKKLTSEHMYRENLSREPNIIMHKNKFLAASAGNVTKDQANKLDDEGVIREGEIVQPGDILIGALRKEDLTRESKQIGLFNKRLLKPVKPRTQTWTKDAPGVVNRVVKHGKNITVHVKTMTPATVGDKIVGRHGNKGIVTSVVPDHEMPYNKAGDAMEVLLNPAGVPGRINLGQVLETAASKIAKKKGSPYVVNNFDPGNKDYTRNLVKELKQNNLSDTEDLIDPTTNRKFKDVMVGSQYILKLHHMAEKGLQSRSRDSYDSNMTPKEGGTKGGQTMDALGLYALLAHNARHNIREFQSYKADFNDDFWTSIQAGDPIPPPKVPFVHKKFEGYLKAMGVDVTKDGNSMILSPLTDKKVKEMSGGRVIKDPSLMLRGKDVKPEPKGLFDPEATGTSPAGELGDKWSHFQLADKMPSPFFEKPIRSLLDLNEKQFGEVVSGSEKLNGKTGPEAIVAGIKKIDIKQQLAELTPQLKTLKGTSLNKVNKKVKYLKSLQRAKLSPTEAYTQSLVPVLPPTMRPFAILDDGSIKYDDTNELYKQIGATNDQLRRFDPAMEKETKIELQKELYDGLKGLAINGVTSRGRHFSGIAESIAGKTQAKEGFFQKKVIGRRQDLSMRSTIVPEPSLSLDEIAIPRKAAAEVYKPFTVRRLVRLGYAPLQAQRLINENAPIATQALETEVSERPMLVKRDPVLHRYGVQAFKPRLVKGKAIKIHPLVTGGYNADFDGDKMSAYVPVSQQAVREAYGMMPSKNLFSPAHGKVMFVPNHEAQLGLYKLTKADSASKKSFKNLEDLEAALGKGSVGINELINMGDIGGEDFNVKMSSIRTTPGRLAVFKALPPELRDSGILTDADFALDNKQLAKIMTDTGNKVPLEFGRTADALKDMGNAYATGASFGLKDFMSDKVSRDPILAKARDAEIKIREKTMSKEKKEQAIVDLYVKAGTQIDKRARPRADKSGNRMYDWVKAGARGNWDQFKQMTVAPILVADSRGKPVPIPITRSYSEGQDIGSYWATMHGARMGTIGKVQGTMQPGMLSKQMSNVSMRQVVVDEDCGTTKGTTLDVNDRDVLGRFTSEAINLGVRGGKDKGSIPSGTLIDTKVLNRLKNNRPDDSRVHVRTPLRCSHGDGLCAKCAGLNENGDLHQPGTNVGIMASQALGEPATQLSMKAFHSGGVVGAKETTASTDMFARLQQLLGMPKTLPGSAVLATADGKVEQIQDDPAGGWNVFVKGKRHYVPQRRDLQVKKGQSIKKGESLSSGPKNPHELLEQTNLPTVQRYISDEIYDIYQGGGPVKRRNVETFVRSLTNLGEVEDAGDHPEFLPGDKVPLSEVNSFNGKLKSGKTPVKAKPMLKSVAMLPRELETDWIARMNGGYLKQTLIDAAAEGWKSQVHSTHPIPSMSVGAEFGLSPKDKPWQY